MNAAARCVAVAPSALADRRILYLDSLGDARFVFVTRDPVERLWSGARHRLDAQLAAGEVTPKALIARFAASVEADDDRDVARCDYRRTTAALESSFDPRRVLYLFHETLFDQATYDRQTSFVGVDRRRARPGRQVNRGPKVVRPDAAMRTRARGAAGADRRFRARTVRGGRADDMDAVKMRAQRTRGVTRWTATATTF